MTVTKVNKPQESPSQTSTIVAAAKTRVHIQHNPKPATASSSSGSADPWLRGDPWSGYQGIRTPVKPTDPSEIVFTDQHSMASSKASRQRIDELYGIDSPYFFPRGQGHIIIYKFFLYRTPVTGFQKKQMLVQDVGAGKNKTRRKKTS